MQWAGDAVGLAGMTDFDSFAEIERDGWADAGTAAAYARDFAQAAAQCVPKFVELAKVGPGDRALDLCCGHGVVAKGLVETGAVVTGVDFSPAMLEVARATVPGAGFEAGDAMALTLADASFDAVTIGFGVPHIPYPDKAFAEARRVLKNGGRIVYSVWKAPEPGDAFAIVFEAIKAHGDPDVQLPAAPGTHDYAEAERAQKALHKAGFADVALTDVGSYWEVSDPGAPFDYFMNGTVRGGALLRPQSDKRKERIREAVAEKVARRPSKGGRWRVPVPAVLVSATAI